MHTHTATQRGEGDGWHYVSLCRGVGRPLGYCAEHEPHSTEAEARECYARWQRDHVRISGFCSWTSCDVGRSPDSTDEPCPNTANRLARIEGDGYHLAALCEQHLTVENAIRVMGLDQPAGDAWVS